MLKLVYVPLIFISEGDFHIFFKYATMLVFDASNNLRMPGDSVVLLQGTKAFCSGGDQALRSKDGYADYENFGRLNVLDLQVHYKFCFEVCSSL